MIRHIISATALILTTAAADLPTPSTLSVVTDTNGSLTAPSNFITANFRLASTIVVDGTNGDDTKAQRGTAQPFASLQAAFTNLQSGDILRIRPGTYTVEAATYTTDAGSIAPDLYLHNLSNIVIEGDNSTIQATNYGHILTLEGCSNVTLRGLTFTGSTNGIDVMLAIAAAVNHRGTNNLTHVTECSFLDIPDQAISHCWSTYNRPSRGWTIDHNFFKRVGTTNHPGLPGYNDGSLVSGAPRDLIFAHNRAEDCYGPAIEFDTSAEGGDDYGEAEVSGNILTGVYHQALAIPCWSGVVQRRITLSGNVFAQDPTTFHPSGTGLIMLWGAQDIVIQGNVLTAASNSPVALINVNHGLGSFTNAVCSNIVVSANTLIGGTYGIYAVNAAQGVAVVGNTFRDQGTHSVQLWANGFSVVGNTFLGAGRVFTNGYCVDVINYGPPTGDNGLVAHNVYRDLQDPPTTMGFFYGYLVGATNVMIGPNSIGELAAGGTNYNVTGTPAPMLGRSAMGSLSQTLAPSGAAWAPGLAFTEDPDTGWYRDSSTVVATIDGLMSASTRPWGFTVRHTNLFGWYDDQYWTNTGTFLTRASAGVVGVHSNSWTPGTGSLLVRDVTAAGTITANAAGLSNSVSLGALPEGTPSDPTNAWLWVRISINGTNAYIPIHQ